MGLTPKQKAFSDEYIKNGGNAAQAAKTAGYSENTVINATRDILGKPCVRDYIAEKQGLREKEKGYAPERTLPLFLL